MAKTSRAAAILAAVLGLATGLNACSRPMSAASDNARTGPAAESAAPAAAGPPAAARANAAKPVAPSQPGAVTAPLPPTTPMLAYAYRYGFVLPADAVRPMMQRHQRACEAAGPLTCQVTSADAANEGHDIARATLTLRATPEWLKGFREGLEGEAKGAGGRLASSNTTTEDLTRAIVDTEAQNRARTVLRDRLERILAERPGDLSDALQLETEIARVQGEIDAAASELQVMRGRVAMSQVTLDYRSEGVAAPEGVMAPLSDALKAFLGNVVKVFAGLVVLVSYLLPFVIVAVPVVWLVLRWRRRRKPAAPPAPAPPAR